MKFSKASLLFPLLAAGSFGLLGGCVADGGYAESGTVYGGFGYTGPVYYDAPGYVEGGIYAHPAYDRHDDAHPAARGSFMPSAPRPAAARPAAAAHGGGDRDRH